MGTAMGCAAPTETDQIGQILGNYADPAAARRVAQAYMPDLMRRGLGDQAMTMLLSCADPEELDIGLDLLDTFAVTGDEGAPRRQRNRGHDPEDEASLREYLREHGTP